jgi:hypothetical protein
VLAAFKAYVANQEGVAVGRQALTTAIQTLALERSSLLGQRECFREGHDSPEIKWWIFGADLVQATQEPSAMKWQLRRHDFFNLGRSALVSPAVGVEFSTDVDKRRYTLDLPGIPPGEDVHVIFYLDASLGQVDIEFFEAATDERQAKASKLMFEENAPGSKVHFFSQKRSEGTETIVSLEKIREAEPLGEESSFPEYIE